MASLPSKKATEREPKTIGVLRKWNGVAYYRESFRVRADSYDGCIAHLGSLWPPEQRPPAEGELLILTNGETFRIIRALPQPPLFEAVDADV